MFTKVVFVNTVQERNGAALPAAPAAPSPAPAPAPILPKGAHLSV